MNPSERNYSQTEREDLAMVYGVKKCHQYLYGLKFKIYTDHKPLLGIFGENKPIPVHSAARVQRWAIIMASYDYELLYRPGEKHGNADGMSRLPIQGKEGEDSQVQNQVFMVDLVHAPVKAEEVKRSTERNPVLSRVSEFLREGWPAELAVNEDLKPYQRRSDDCITITNSKSNSFISLVAEHLKGLLF